MKKILLLIAIIAIGVNYASAQQAKADIKFDETTINVGEFSEKNPVVTATYNFTNVGNGPLVIHQAIASCGCTVPEYSEEPILPGKTGSVKVVYNGKGKSPGYFKKSITLRTNAKTEMIRLFIEGTMLSKKESKE